MDPRATPQREAVEPTNSDLGRVLGILRRRAPLIVLCTVVVAAVAFGLSKQATEEYTATAALTFNENPRGQQIAGLPVTSATGGELLAREAADVELVKGSAAGEETARKLGIGPLEVFERTSVDGQGESGIVTISATTTSPIRSAKIANTYARRFVAAQQSANRDYYRTVLAIVHKQLKALSPQQRESTDGSTLRNRVQTLGLLAELKEGSAVLAAQALVPTSPSSPKTTKNTAVGAIAGLLIGLALAFLLERLSRRVRSSEELAEAYGLPLLGTVPKLRRRGKKRGAALTASEEEAFALLQAHLRTFGDTRNVRSVMIASAVPEEGKTTIARNLAASAAAVGAHVLLIEANLRTPALGAELGLPTYTSGLSDVLVGAVTRGEATVEVELPDHPQAGGRSFDVLLAGNSADHPAELLAGPIMDAVLESTAAVYDLVVIDSPALLAAADAFSLLGKVDGTILVGRLGSSRTADITRLGGILAKVEATLLGVVANEAKDGDRSLGAYRRPRAEAGVAPAAGPETAPGASAAEPSATNA